MEPATTEVQTETPTNEAMEPTSGLTISTSSSPNVSEAFLVDGQGRALYLFTKDTPDSGTSTYLADCIAEWPPLVIT